MESTYTWKELSSNTDRDALSAIASPRRHCEFHGRNILDVVAEQFNNPRRGHPR
jgi:hypothetical protein